MGRRLATTGERDLERGQSVSALPPESPAPVPKPPADPPCLCRRGPARLHLTLKNGDCPRMSRGRVHLRAGKTFVVQVVPPSAHAKVEINVDPAIHTEVSAAPVAGGEVPTYHGEYAGHLPQRVLPWPITAKLCVVVSDGLPKPCRVTIPVTVWPSLALMGTWWLLVFLGLVGFRWQSAIASAKSMTAVWNHVLNDLPFVGGVFLLGVPILGLLQALGWVATARSPGED